MQRRVGIRPLLLGQSLTDRTTDRTAIALNAHIRGVNNLLPKVYGDSEASKQAQMEFGRIIDFPDTKDGAWCRRAALLFALAREREMVKHFAEQERKLQGDNGRPTYAEDLHSRVLPFVLPRFLKHSCQAPDTFVVLTLVLAEMWEGENLGNWPGGASAPHLDPMEAAP